MCLSWRALLQPHTQGLLLIQNGGSEKPLAKAAKVAPNIRENSSCKHREISLFPLNNGFQLQKTNRATLHWKQPLKKPLHHVSYDKILHDSWSISAALSRGFSNPPLWTRRRPWGQGWVCYIGILFHTFFTTLSWIISFITRSLRYVGVPLYLVKT